MSKEDQQNISDGWRLWLADQVTSIRGSLGKLESQAVNNWQAIGQVHHQLTHRMDRLEDRMANGRRRHWLSYLKYIPWQFLILFAATALVISGHLTLSDFKAALIERLQKL